MITGKLRQDVDRLWEEFWTGGITNPLTVIEQISFLMFSRMLDIREGLNERKAKRLKGKTDVKMIFGPDQQHLRWSQLQAQAGAGDAQDRPGRGLSALPHGGQFRARPSASTWPTPNA